MKLATPRILPLISALVLVATASCAPAARPAEGPVSDAVTEALESGTASFDHAAWGSLLAEGTRDGLVDYRYFQEHRGKLDAYLDEVAQVDLAALSAGHLMALLANAYNALTVRSILDHPGVASIRDIPGVWKGTTHTVGGHPLTLDEIEHGILRPYYKDPRVHFAVNCASASCAPLPPWALDGDRIDDQLEELRRDFLRDPANVRVEGGRLLLSKYFDWYGDDFTAEGWVGAAATVAAYVRPAAAPEVAAFIDSHDGDPPVTHPDYDWSLNAAVPPDPDVSPGEETAGADEGGYVAGLRDWVSGFGPLAPVVYAVAYSAATVAFVPGSALTVGAGVAFDLLIGTAVVSFGATVGAAICFLLARTLLRSRVERWVAGKEKFASLDEAVARQGWKIVFLTRLSPVFPFNLLNYAYGLTGIGFWPYVLASWVGMIPGTVLYVYIGAAGAQAAEAATGAASWGRTALQIVGLAATLVVTVIITRVARKALREAQA